MVDSPSVVLEAKGSEQRPFIIFFFFFFGCSRCGTSFSLFFSFVGLGFMISRRQMRKKRKRRDIRGVQRESQQ